MILNVFKCILGSIRSKFAFSWQKKGRTREKGSWTAGWDEANQMQMHTKVTLLLVVSKVPKIVLAIFLRQL